MSKAEKRYFTRFAEMTGGKQSDRYIALFAAIEAMEEDDTEELSARLGPGALRDALAVYRNRLQALILRSLRTLYAGRWAGSEVRQLLEEIELLYERRLHQLCAKRLEKALELARAHQMEPMLLELEAWRRRLAGLASTAAQDALLEEVRAEEEACMARLDLERNAAHEHERMRVKARLRLLTRSAATPPAQAPLPAHANFLTRIHHLSAKGIVELSSNDMPAANSTYRAIMQLWEGEPQRIHDHSDLFLQTMNNHLSVLLLGDTHHNEFLEAVQQLRSLTDLPRHTRVHFQWVGYHQELMFSMNFAGYDATLHLVADIEDWINANAQEILVPRLLAFYFNITMFFFVNGEYTRANRWLQRILNQPGRADRRDIRNFARILQVLIHYELREIDLNEYLVRSAYRYLNRKDELYDFENAIFDLIRRCSALPGEPERLPVYQEFKKTLAELKAQAKAGLGHGEMLLWVESKIAGVPPRALFEQRLAENQRAAQMK